MKEHDRAEPERHLPERHLPERQPPGQPHAEGEEPPDEATPEQQHPQKEQEEESPTREVHLSVKHLHGPEEVHYAEDELVVVCLVRDGRPYVKSFVEHYLSLGAKHVFFLDNGSTDGTVEDLKSYDHNVTVLRSTLPYKNPRGGLGGTETLFKQYLMDRFGRKGRWVLCADIDELFDYPYSDIVGLGSLLGYLKAKSCTAVTAQMLDMFPEEPLSGRAVDPDEPLQERHRFYDVSGIRRRSIEEHPRLRNNAYESDDIEAFHGGIRETIFGTSSYLTKFPLVFLDGRVKPFDRSAHWVDNAKIADLTCVLYHYKFLDGYFHDQAAQAVRVGQYHNNSARYKKYLKVLDGNPALQVKQESSRELRRADDLVEDGFLVVSEDYMVLVYEHQERNRGAARQGDGRGDGHRDAPGRGSEEVPGDQQAALRRARARAKVESLRARRLQRQLDQLSEQNRREVDKFAAKLARARKKNRNLAHQLRSMKASRSWRLLNRLARLRAGVQLRKP